MTKAKSISVPSQDGRDCHSQVQVVFALVKHFSQFDCLPFPAGPRVPRRASDQPAPINLGLSREVRAERAMRVLTEVFGEKADRDPRSRHLKQHLWVAPAEWASRHRAREIALQMFGEDLPMLFDAIATLYEGKTKSRDQTGIDGGLDQLQLIKRLKEKRHEDQRAYSPNVNAARPRLEESELCYLHPFSAAAYDSACCVELNSGVEEEFGKPSDAEFAFVDARCKSSNGAWPLLAMLFLKLLFSHFGYMALKPHMAARLKLFFAPVRRILLRIVHDDDRDPGLAEAAAGLATHLPKIAPIYRKKGSDIEWHADAPGLPDCFNLFLLGLEAQSRAEAKALFAKVDSADKGPLASLAEDVVELAREVASLLTDPLAAPTLDALGFNCKAFESLRCTLNEQRRTFGNQLKRGQLATAEAKGGFIGRCVPQADAARVFAPRMRRIIEYSRWMSEQGVDAVNAVNRAANTV